MIAVLVSPDFPTLPHESARHAFLHHRHAVDRYRFVFSNRAAWRSKLLLLSLHGSTVENQVQFYPACCRLTFGPVSHATKADPARYSPNGDDLAVVHGCQYASIVSHNNLPLVLVLVGLAFDSFGSVRALLQSHSIGF